MKRWILILGCSLMLCGCTESNIVSKGGELSPDFETREGIELQWDQAFEDMSSEYIDGEEITDMAFFMNEEENGTNTLYITALANPQMTPHEAAELGTRMVKSMSDFFAEQDFSLASSSENSYGGFSQKYNIGVRIIPEDQTSDQSMALVDDLINVGDEYRPIKTNR